MATDVCDYTIKNKIGTGTYGTVYKADHAMFGLVAIKELKEDFFNPTEIDLMSRLDHPYLAKAITILDPNRCPKLSKLSLIMPLAGGNLYSIYKKDCKLGDSVRIKIIKQIVDAISFLHTVGVLHLDIKLENILYQGEQMDPDILVTDFGLSQYVDDPVQGRKLNNIYVTITYRPPELLVDEIDGNKEYLHNAAVDIWSLGILFLEILSNGKLVFGRMSEDDFNTSRMIDLINERFYSVNRKSWIEKFLRASGLKGYYSLAVSMLDRMLAINPINRASMDEIQNSELFSISHMEDSPEGQVYQLAVPQLKNYASVYDDVFDSLQEIILYTDELHQLPVSVFFLVIDLYVLGSVYCLKINKDTKSSKGLKGSMSSKDNKLYKMNRKEARLLAASSLAIAYQMINEGYSLPNEIFELFKVEVSEVEQHIPILIESLGGILYREFIYHACQATNQLVEMYYHLGTIESYSNINLKKILNGNPPSDYPKDITIGEFRDLIEDTD